MPVGDPNWDYQINVIANDATGWTLTAVSHSPQGEHSLQ